MRPAVRVTSPVSRLVRRLRALALRISQALRRIAARRPAELAAPRTTSPLRTASPAAACTASPAAACTASPATAGTASPATAGARDPHHLPPTPPALAAVHASIASAIGDHASLGDFTVRHVGHLVEVSVHVGPTNRRFVVDSRDDDFVLRLQARLLTALPRPERAG